MHIHILMALKSIKGGSTISISSITFLAFMYNHLILTTRENVCSSNGGSVFMATHKTRIFLFFCACYYWNCCCCFEHIFYIWNTRSWIFSSSWLSFGFFIALCQHTHIQGGDKIFMYVSWKISTHITLLNMFFRTLLIDFKQQAAHFLYLRCICLLCWWWWR